MKMDPVIFREYDIRGVYNEQFDNAFAFELGRAIATFTMKRLGLAKVTLTLGMDARLSSPQVLSSVSDGINSVGCDSIDLGLVTTPISYFSTFTMDNVNGSVMITGSHNPPNYNGFKISVGKSTISGEDILALKTLIDANDYPEVSKGEKTSHDIFPAYLERYKKEFGQLKNIPVVLDCGNGAAGSITRRLYEAVGLTPTILFEEPDGNFPNHHPDPTVEENLVALAAEVKKTGAKVGIGFDGDADRIGVVNAEGKMIYGDELMMFFARDILKKNPGEIIVGDVKCSDRMYDAIKEVGGKPVMWKTGHSLVKNKIKAEKSPFGGELSGHIFFADRNYGYDDAPYAGLRLIEILSSSNKTMDEHINLPKSFNTPEIRIDTTEENKHLIVKTVKEHFPEGSADYKVNLIDGIRLSFKNGWALVRASNTQPVVVFRFEADTQSDLDEIRSKVEKTVSHLL